MQGINSDTIDLIYLDPPFNTGAQYHAPIGTTAEGAEFSDIWQEDPEKQWELTKLADTHPEIADYIECVDEFSRGSMKWYLIFMAVRLLEMHRILKPTGSIFLHCDPNASHYLKLLLDSIFGHANYKNELIWAYRGPGNVKRKFPSKHDTILFYVKEAKNAKFYPQYTEMLEETRKKYNQQDEDGRWFQRQLRDGVLHKSYLDENPGRPVVSWWDDIPSFSNNKERTGYPTQKPLKILERIITATTDPYELILDPFCGCATTCVAAHRLERQWVGIDVSAKAHELVMDRLSKDANAATFWYPWKEVSEFTVPPVRTDLGQVFNLDSVRVKQEVKEKLYGQQKGFCASCPPDIAHFQIQHLEIDHITPKSRGGQNNIENLQLLCGSCNRIKGNRPMEYLIQQITRRRLQQVRQAA